MCTCKITPNVSSVEISSIVWPTLFIIINVGFLIFKWQESKYCCSLVYIHVRSSKFGRSINLFIRGSKFNDWLMGVFHHSKRHVWYGEFPNMREVRNSYNKWWLRARVNKLASTLKPLQPSTSFNTPHRIIVLITYVTLSSTCKHLHWYAQLNWVSN